MLSLSWDEITAYRQLRTGGDRSRLEWAGYKIASQSDEDGIIAEIFRRIGPTNRIFVEFGAETGQENNCRALLGKGWRGLWMEANPDYAGAIRWNHRQALAAGRLSLIEAFINDGNINDLIAGAGITGEIDFLSIDIDGLDYYVFDTISVIAPRVVCLEHNPDPDLPRGWIMPYDLSYRWWPTKGVLDFGADLTAMRTLANRKGYELVGCSLYGNNGFYVRRDLVADRFTGPFAEDRLFNPLIYDAVVRFPVEGVAQDILLMGEDARNATHDMAVRANEAAVQAQAARLAVDRAIAALPPAPAAEPAKTEAAESGATESGATGSGATGTGAAAP